MFRGVKNFGWGFRVSEEDGVGTCLFPKCPPTTLDTGIATSDTFLSVELRTQHAEAATTKSNWQDLGFWVLSRRLGL